MREPSKIESYKAQLEQKQQKLHELLAPFGEATLETFDSPAEHFRMRAEFRVWHEQADTFHIMFDQQSKQRYRVDQLSSASKIINRAMLKLIECTCANEVLRKKLFQIDYLSSTTDELVISMIYHKQLDDLWVEAATKLANTLQSIGKVSIIGRAKKQKIVVGRDYVLEELLIQSKPYYFKQVENSFTQPNAVVNVKMIEWVINNARKTDRDLLELYCGAGNFSIPLAAHFRRVLATEISKTSVNAAQYNIEKNSTNNLKIARLSSEEFVQAYNKVRAFNRLSDINLDDYDFSSVLVDPPRAGLDPTTLDLVSMFEQIIYISCNPNTLVDNLKLLSKTHKVTTTALFDQFPFTQHMESGVILEKR